MTESSSLPGRQPTVAVVGGGIAGLAAAWEIAGAGARAVVLEAGARMGGKIVSAEFGGRVVDLGPDAFVARRPEAVQLCEELGLADELTAPGSRTAYVWSRARLHPLPAGLALGIPTRLVPLAASGILSPGGLGRVAAELCSPPWRQPGPIGEDEAIGPLLCRRLGREVVELLAEPLIGGIHAGSLETMSAAAVFPPLLDAAARPGSLLRNLRPAAGPRSTDGAEPAPVFLTPRGGLSRLVERLCEALTGLGATLRTATAVTGLARTVDGRWVVHSAAGEVEADALVMAVPARPAAELLRAVDAELASLLAAVRYASVALVTMRFSSDAVRSALQGTGYLVPRGQALLTACTWLSSKWPQLARPDDVLLRVSAGHDGDDRPATMDDETLVRRAVDELAPAIGIGGGPLEWRVTRVPDAFAQYDVGHPGRVAAMDEAAARCGLALAGSALHGVGIPACIGSGRRAARAVLARVGSSTPR